MPSADTTTTRPTIGVIGATGAVGRAAAAALHRGADTGLRLGGRRAAALDELARTLPGASRQAVDLFDPDGLDAFCRGCDVVLNCAGPAHEVADRVARAALGSGADYVDAAGDDLLLQQVTRALPARPAVAVVSAGMMPGLTALLPRYLAQSLDGTARTMTGYVGGRDRFTVTAADDYFRGGSTFGTPRTVLRGGRRHAETDSPSGVSLPFFPEPVNATAFLSTETERVCAGLGIGDASWYSVFAGEHVTAAMRAPAGEGAAGALARAAALDCFGRQTYQLVVIELSTGTRVKSLVLRGSTASELTGEFAALSAHLVGRRRIPAGAHHAGEILDPVEAVARLRESACVADVALLDGPARDTGSYVEETV